MASTNILPEVCKIPRNYDAETVELDVVISETLENSLVHLAEDRKISPEDLIREILADFVKTH